MKFFVAFGRTKAVLQQNVEFQTILGQLEELYGENPNSSIYQTQINGMVFIIRIVYNLCYKQLFYEKYFKRLKVVKKI